MAAFTADYRESINCQSVSGGGSPKHMFTFRNSAVVSERSAVISKQDVTDDLMCYHKVPDPFPLFGSVAAAFSVTPAE